MRTWLPQCCELRLAGLIIKIKMYVDSVQFFLNVIVNISINLSIKGFKSVKNDSGRTDQETSGTDLNNVQ